VLLVLLVLLRLRAAPRLARLTAGGGTLRLAPARWRR
jgi:hypothetical protein